MSSNMVKKYVGQSRNNSSVHEMPILVPVHYSRSIIIYHKYSYYCSIIEFFWTIYNLFDVLVVRSLSLDSWFFCHYTFLWPERSRLAITKRRERKKNVQLSGNNRPREMNYYIDTVSSYSCIFLRSLQVFFFLHNAVAHRTGYFFLSSSSSLPGSRRLDHVYKIRVVFRLNGLFLWYTSFLYESFCESYWNEEQHHYLLKRKGKNKTSKVL